MSAHTSERADPRHYGSTAEDRLIYVAHEKGYRFAEAFAERKHVLDVGCGVGYGARILRDRAHAVVGVDVSAEVIADARARFGGEGLRFELVPLDEPSLPFADGYFDLVTCFHVLEHVVREASLVREMARVLAPGGILLLSTPNARFRLLPFQRPWNRFHIREHSARSLRQLVGRHLPEMRLLGITMRDPWLRFEKRRSRRYAVILWPITNALVPSRLRRRLLAMVARLKGVVSRRGRERALDDALTPVLDDIVIQFEHAAECPALLLVASRRPLDLPLARRLPEAER